MRMNLPVIDQEFPFPSGETLVSTTDLKGRILYCNPPFISVSGYSKEELLGQPHNMIRHPDMPEEAYRDMWDTIAKGNPWSAPVKNRRKDGTYYWVMANVTPLMDGDKPGGYMSVRTMPTREQVQAAEALYARMRSEKQAGHLVHTLNAGALVVNTIGSRLKRLFSFGIEGRLVMVAALISALSIALCAVVEEALTGRWLWLANIAIAVSVGLIGGMVLRRMTLTPLQDLLALANRMAAGDLTQKMEVTRTDLIGRLGRALSQLNVNLQSIVRDARTEVEHMRDATAEIAAGNQDLSSRTESQASSLEETAASMEQITGTVKLSVDSAQQASVLADQATQVAQRSSEAVSQVTETMHRISESSNRIGEIIQVIDSIAFQTNILALNAAVEAARAGEQGRGFAVVASEVRALAQRTAGAAKEVKQLIEESTQKVAAGNRLTEGAQKTMMDALQSVRQVSTMISEISSGAREQLAGISQINEAMAQMDTITQQNAALVEEIAASAMQLQGQASTVSETVQVFRLGYGDVAMQDAVALRRANKSDGSRDEDA
jgi:aerotaxis receptor